MDHGPMGRARPEIGGKLMQPYPKNIDTNIQKIADAVNVISRLREEDITDRNTFPSIFMLGRKVGKIPTSSSDIVATDRVGDYNYDVNYFYLLVSNGSGVIWRTIPFTNFSRVFYGSMGADDISVVITFPVAGNYYKLTSGMTAGLTDGFTFQNASELVCLNAGKYKIDYSASFTGSVGQDIGSSIIVNSTNVHLSEAVSTLSTTNRAVSSSGTCIISLAADDVVGLSFENENATNSITVTHANLSIIRVGD